MANYLDLMVQVVPKKNAKAYLKLSEKMGEFLLKHGAKSSHDYISDDENALKLSLGKAFKLKPTEVLVVGTAGFKSRKHRDEVMDRVMADPKFQKYAKPPAFLDQKRGFFGGFETINALK